MLTSRSSFLLAFLHVPFRAETLQLRRGTRRKNAEERVHARVLRNGSRIQDSEMAKNLPVEVHQR